MLLFFLSGYFDSRVEKIELGDEASLISCSTYEFILIHMINTCLPQEAVVAVPLRCQSV
jgi:hypothetical protein